MCFKRSAVSARRGQHPHVLLFAFFRLATVSPHSDWKLLQAADNRREETEEYPDRNCLCTANSSPKRPKVDNSRDRASDNRPGNHVDKSDENEKAELKGDTFDAVQYALDQLVYSCPRSTHQYHHLSPKKD